MNIDTQTKQWIDNASYEQLLERWRNAPIGDIIFQGDSGKYYSMVMKKRRAEVGENGHVTASKNIGWDG